MGGVLRAAAVVVVAVAVLGVLAADGTTKPALSQEAPGLQGRDLANVQTHRPPSSVRLASGVLREAVEQIRRGQTTGLGVDVVDQNVRVEVVHELQPSEVRDLVDSLGGTVEGEIEGLTQALVPVHSLVALEDSAGVLYLRPPLNANIPLLPSSDHEGVVAGAPVVGEEIAKTNADSWHAAGLQGAGVKIGIFDFFDGALWDAAAAAGELPSPAGTFCQANGTSCDIWSAGSDHCEPPQGSRNWVGQDRTNNHLVCR